MRFILKNIHLPFPRGDRYAITPGKQNILCPGGERILLIMLAARDYYEHCYKNSKLLQTDSAASPEFCDLKLFIMQVIPVLRVFDYSKAIEFSVDWLGCTINWEYQPENSLTHPGSRL